MGLKWNDGSLLCTVLWFGPCMAGHNVAYRMASVCCSEDLWYRHAGQRADRPVFLWPCPKAVEVLRKYLWKRRKIIIVGYTRFSWSTFFVTIPIYPLLHEFSFRMFYSLFTFDFYADERAFHFSFIFFSRNNLTRPSSKWLIRVCRGEGEPWHRNPRRKPITKWAHKQ